MQEPSPAFSRELLGEAGKPVKKKAFFIRRQALLIIAFLFLISFLFLREQVSKEFFPSEKQLEGRVSREKSFWAERIAAVGAEQAYEEFKAAFGEDNFGVQHKMAHIFGELLYEKIGFDGVAVCDNVFSFGCYHGFFGLAIAGSGKGVIKELDQACIRKWGVKGTGCQHGIGHGLLAQLGPGGLLEALEACSTLTWKRPIGGCSGGVFMEYNYRTMEDPTKVKIRELEPDDPHSPCSSLPAKFLQACYYSQADWWEKVYTADYAKIGVLCEGLSGPRLREACYQGLGNTIAPSTDFDVEESIVACDKMPTANGRILCRSGVSWSFWAQPEYRSLSVKICKGLAEAEKYCVQKSNVYDKEN